MRDTTIFTVCRKGFPGADRALVNLSASTGLTRHLTLAGTNPDGPEIQFLIWHLRETKPSIVLFGGWDPVYQLVIDALAGVPIRFGVYWTSSGGQSDISQEMAKLVTVLRAPAITYHLFCSEGLAKGFQIALQNAHYLPLTLPVDSFMMVEKIADSPFTISLFCSPPEYKRKNIFNSLLAFAGLTGNYRVLLNGLSSDEAYGEMLDILQIPYHDSGWMAREDYEEQFAQIDLGLQLSFAESFNYVAADHLVRGVPVLVSPMVPVVQSLSPGLREKLMVVEADDSAAIQQRLQLFNDDRELARDIGRQARAELAVSNQQNIAISAALLEALI